MTWLTAAGWVTFAGCAGMQPGPRKGAVIAHHVADLHPASSNLTKQTALTKKGTVVNDRTEPPSKHDMLPGAWPDGNEDQQHGFAMLHQNYCPHFRQL